MGDIFIVERPPRRSERNGFMKKEKDVITVPGNLRSDYLNQLFQSRHLIRIPKARPNKRIMHYGGAYDGMTPSFERDGYGMVCTIDIPFIWSPQGSVWLRLKCTL